MTPTSLQWAAIRLADAELDHERHIQRKGDAAAFATFREQRAIARLNYAKALLDATQAAYADDAAAGQSS